MSDVQEQIKKMVTDNKIILFMKGTAQAPQCGFSASVIHILNQYDVPYETINALSNPEIRQGIKTFSNWPTLPQLYVNGEFIGGCDIVTEMHENGEFKDIIEKAK